MRTSRRIAFTLCVAAIVGGLIAGCGLKGAKETHFGAPFKPVPTATIGRLLETPDAFSHQVVHVKGTIERQCPVAGCWFFINDGQGHSIKIELGDYLAKLPQNIGNTAEVEGEWIKKGTTYEFIGTSVTFTSKGAP